MNAYAFTRLYWRSSMIVVLAVIGTPLIGFHKVFLMVEKHVGFKAWYFPDSGNVVLLALPFAWGFLVGASIAEVFNGRFSWTLPGARRDFGLATIFCGAVISVATPWVHHLAGGEVTPLAAAAIAAFWYALSVHAQVSTGRGLVKSRLGLIGGGLVVANAVASLGVRHPWLVSGLALAAAAAASYRVFGLNNLRDLKEGPRRSLISGFTMYTDASHRGELLAHAKPTRADWRRGYLGSSLLSWVKAFEHEQTGDYFAGAHRLGAYKRPLFFVAGAVAVPAVFGINREMFDQATMMKGLTTWVRELYEFFVLVDADSGEPIRANIVWKITSVCVAAWAFECAMPTNKDRLAGLRPKFLYPLSRRLQGQINFWFSAFANARYVGVTLAVFYTAAVLCSMTVHEAPDWSAVPSIVFPLALTFLTTPAVQAIGTCYMPRLMAFRSVTLQKISITVPLLGAAGLIGFGSAHWAALSSHFSQVGQVVAVVAAAVVIHIALNRRLQRHFAEADLTY